MPSTFAIPAEELDGSPTFTQTRGKATGRQMFRIRWEDIDAFVNYIFPAPYISGDQIIIPVALNFPNRIWLIADSLDIGPFDPVAPHGFGEVPNIYPGGAKVTVDYKTPEYDQTKSDQQKDDPDNPYVFVKHKITGGGEFLTYPAGGLTWDQPGDAKANPALPKDFKCNDDVSVIIGLIEHQMTWPYVPFPPWRAMRACIGKVNAQTFMGAAPETLLFLGYEADREITSNGIRFWNLEYKFAEKNQNPGNANPQGWNHFLRPDGPGAGTFQRLNKKSGVSQAATVLAADVQAGDTFIKVQSPAGFPRSVSFSVQIAGVGIRTVAPTGGFSIWNIGAAGAAYKKGDTVVQWTTTTTSGAISATQTVIPLAEIGAFTGSSVPFNIQIDGEIIQVIAISGNNAIVLRGVNGTAAVAHGSGRPVVPGKTGIYQAADFRSLFLAQVG